MIIWFCLCILIEIIRGVGCCLSIISIVNDARPILVMVYKCPHQLDTAPVCSTNVTTAGIEEGDNMFVSCELGYSGRWAPQIDFIDPLGMSHEGVNATVSRGTAVYTLTLPADRAWTSNGDFIAVMFIQDIAESEDPPNTNSDEADNQPTFPGNEEALIDIPDFEVWCKYIPAFCVILLLCRI